MKQISFIMGACLLTGLANAQIVQPTVPDIHVDNIYPSNSGIAVSPQYGNNLSTGVIAPVYDYPQGYRIQWFDESGNLLDHAAREGSDPDIAYTETVEDCVVGIEKNGGIELEHFRLTSNTPILYSYWSNDVASASGSYPNVDINSNGNGVVCYERAGEVWAVPFIVTTVVQVTGSPVQLSTSGGTQPDIVLLDSEDNIVVTYINGSGRLMIESFNYSNFLGGTATLTSQYFYNPTYTYFNYPRISANRHANYASVDYYAVVASEDNGSGYDVHGYFYCGGAAPVYALVNNALENCSNPVTRPVVTHDRGRVHVIWGQTHTPICGSPASTYWGEDVLMGEFTPCGTNLNGATNYLRINTASGHFPYSISAINVKYDALLPVSNTTAIEAVFYTDDTDSYIKRRSAASPSYMPTAPSGITVSKLAEASDIEVTVHDAAISEMYPATFRLYNQLGQEIELLSTGQDGNVYHLDAKNLSSGTYLLHYEQGDHVATERLVHLAH